MSVRTAATAFLDEAPADLSPDPLTSLLEKAYRALASENPAGSAGLIVATDGSRIGQQRVFHLASRRGGKIPPKLIPFRLSNGPASFLAIAHGHTGRVLTFADGPSSLARAITYASELLAAGAGPDRWIVVSGEAFKAADPVRGWAVALDLRRETPDAAS